MDVEFTGMAELEKKMLKFADARDLEKNALKEGAQYLKEEAENSVYSYGLKRRTGKSEKSMVAGGEILNGTIEVGLSNQNNDAFYLYFHEFGTSKMPARPFLRPTFEREKSKIIDIMANEVKKGMGL